MLNELNFNHLYYFFVIASEGSLAKATKVLNVSQPTLSQQLKQLEKQMGKKLFNRTGRALQLNDHGEYILDFAKKMFFQAELMVSSFSYRQQMTSQSHFKIGITSSVSRTYASKLLKPLFEKSDINVSIIEVETERLIEKLYAREVDFILSESLSEHQLTDAIKVIDIKKPEYVFVCGEKFSKKVVVVPKDLDGMPYFKYSPLNHLQREVDKYFYESGVLPNVVGESDNIDIMLAATESNNCFSIVPKISIKEELVAGRLFHIGNFSYSNTKICALILDDHTNKAIEEVVNEIKSSL
jgi:LysR family transcriptional activator of nhaA